MKPDRVISVPENLKLGTILTTLNATDSDADAHNSMITYSSKFQNSNFFSVDTHKGTVTLNTSLDFELSQEHELIIDAVDPEGFSCSFNLKVVVLDINDNQPIFDAIEINAIPEDAPLGSLVGKINARDLDSGKFYTPICLCRFILTEFLFVFLCMVTHMFTDGNVVPRFDSK